MQSRNTFITSHRGISLELHPHEYWYLAPSRITYEPGEVVGYQDFAIVLHNAKLGHGVTIALDDLLKGVPTATYKNGSSREAEMLIERIRVERFPYRPSRLRSYFLNYSRAVAEDRMNSMFRGNRTLVRCQVVLNNAKFHHGDVEIFEKLTGRPDDVRLAESYWQEFKPVTIDEFKRLEVVADSMLYFPDWQGFPELDKRVLIAWQESRALG